MMVNEVGDETGDEPTLESNNPAFLVPRLATFASDDGNAHHDEFHHDRLHRAEPFEAYVGVEESLQVLGGAGEMLGGIDANAISFHGDEVDEQRHGYHICGDAENAIAASHIDDDGDDDDNNLLEVDDFPLDHEEDDSEEATSAAITNDRARFPLSRVRELLKHNSIFSTVAKDAAVAASEAVVLILQDLTRLAAAEAERQHRKTVTYADVARVVHYFDRFSFLADIIPPVPTPTSGMAKVLVGQDKSSAAGVQTNRGSTREMDRLLSQMTEEELRKEYVQLRRTNACLAEESSALQTDISALCEESVRFQQSTEIEEDKMANQLLRRLQTEELQKRRFRSMIRREEGARRQIMEQIAQVRVQKTELESQLAQEQESLMLQLQKKLVEVVNKKSEVERELLRERREYLEVLSTKLARIKKGSLGAIDNTLERAAPRGGLMSKPCHLQTATATATTTATAGASSSSSSSSSSPVAAAALETETAAEAAAEAAAEEEGSVKKAPLRAQAFSCASFDTHDAISHLEKHLNRLLRKHAAAVKASSINEALCTELGQNLDSIQQAAFLDRARASKLREELLGAKKRLSELERQISVRGVSVTSEISSGLPTPTISCVKNVSLGGRTKELLLAQHRQTNSSFHHSCDVSDAGEETHLCLSPLWSPSARLTAPTTAHTTASDEGSAALLTSEQLISGMPSTGEPSKEM